jgi:hypothetical protein
VLVAGCCGSKTVPSATFPISKVRLGTVADSPSCSQPVSMPLNGLVCVMPSAPPWLEECGSEGGVANNSRRVVDQDPGRATRDTSVAGDTEPEAMTGVAYLSLGARIVGSTLKGA